MSKDSNIQHSLSGILTVVDEYDSEMAELADRTEIWLTAAQWHY